MQTRNTRKAGPTCLAALAVVTVDATAAELPEVSATLEEVVVTAEKRAESVQDVSMSITALSSRDLDRKGAMSLQDVASGVPSLAFRSAGPGRQKVSLRGISSSAGVSSTVGYYLDETAISTTSSAAGTSFQQTNLDPDLFDVERIEILKGPQGTLYGSGSMGGTVKVVTKQPNLKRVEAKLNTQGSSTSGGGKNYAVNAALNVPLASDALAVRVAASYRSFDGFVDRRIGNFEDGGTVDGSAADPAQPGTSPLSGVTLPDRAGSGPTRTIDNVNTEDVGGVRAALRWQLSDDFYIQPAVFWQRATQDGKPSVDTIPAMLDQRRPFDIEESYQDEFSVYSLTMAYELPRVTVLSATGFSDRAIDNVEDGTDQMTYGFGYYNLNDSNFLPAQRVLASTGSLVTLADLFSDNLYPATVQPYPAATVERNSMRDFTQEVRLTSVDDGSKLKWTAGAYYKTVDREAGHVFDLDGYSAAFPLYAQLGQLVFGPGGWPWGDLLAQSAIVNRLRETAAFGQLTYQLTDALEITLGGRYYDYAFSFERNDAGLFYGGGTALSGTPKIGDAEGDGFNPKVLLSYAVGEGSLLYVTASKGFRIGAANAPVPAARCAGDLAAIGRSAAPDQYDPDSLWNYEIGSKNRLLDGRMTLNLALFDIEWQGIQQQISLPTCGFAYSDNAGDARSRGFELEMEVSPVEFLNISAGVGYADAEITRAAPGTGLRAGDPLIDVPEWTANVAVEVTFRGWWNTEGYARTSLSYVDESLDTYSEPVKPAYRQVDARIGLTRDRWDVSLFGNNLSNEHPVFTRVDTIGQTMPLYHRAVIGRPRTIGISVSWSY